MIEPNFKILETTLRDGSYVIDYQFNAEESGYIAKILDQIGFDYIEIGPGVGFNAHKFSNPKPASSDEEYIISARESVKNAKIGMFFIPGIAEKDNIYMAKEHGLDLIRIGTDVNKSQKGFKYLELCNKLNIETAANLMKSYAVDSKEFSKIANECYKAGAHTVYLVDSAGGMLPDDVRRFLMDAKNLNPDIKLGFHGHDNLGLSIANTLVAIDCGVDIVDSSIRGMGRSSGNTITEKLIFVLKRLGYKMKYDMDRLLDLSDKIIVNYLSNKPEKSLDIIYGFSQFHSSYMPLIRKMSDKYKIRPRDLIIEYTKNNKLNVNEDELENISKKLTEKPFFFYDFKIDNITVEEKNSSSNLKKIIQNLIQLKFKFNKKIFFNISKSYENDNFKISSITHFNDSIAFASAELSSKKEISKITDNTGEFLDGFLVDERLKLEFNEIDKDFFLYNDASLFAETIYNYLESINNKENNKLINVFIEEREEIQNFLLKKINQKSYSLVNSIYECDVAIIGKNNYQSFDFKNLEKTKWIIITKNKCVNFNNVESCEINFIKINLEQEIFNKISEKFNYGKIMNSRYGIKKIGNNNYCSGGFIGPPGSIVVDDINDIRQKYGTSNGDGSIKYFTNIKNK